MKTLFSNFKNQKAQTKNIKNPIIATKSYVDIMSH